MMETQNYWDENSAHSMQVKYESLNGRSCKDEIYRMGGYCESNLNFATASEDDEVYPKKKVSRQDPMSHRIIEKRRRDRMNNCLADLSRLIPAEYLKKGRGRVEKTEIIEMAIRHMKYLQETSQDVKHPSPNPIHQQEDSIDSVSHSTNSSIAIEHYRLGFQECLSEIMHFLVQSEGFLARDTFCMQLISHLQQHCEKIVATSDRLGFPNPEIPSVNAFNNTNFTHAADMCQKSNNTSFDNGSRFGTNSSNDTDTMSCNPMPAVTSDDSNHSTHFHTTPSTKPSNYKFKSSIKQRFSAERIKESSMSPVEKPHNVPIFALHEGGTFYVPLTLESSLLSPQLGYIADTGPDISLHPVTISVNFNQTSPLNWPHQSPTYHDNSS